MRSSSSSSFQCFALNMARSFSSAFASIINIDTLHPSASIRRSRLLLPVVNTSNRSPATIQTFVLPMHPSSVGDSHSTWCDLPFFPSTASIGTKPITSLSPFQACSQNLERSPLWNHVDPPNQSPISASINSPRCDLLRSFFHDDSCRLLLIDRHRSSIDTKPILHGPSVTRHHGRCCHSGDYF